MKIVFAGLVLLAALAVSGCSAGVSVGSASYNADERGTTLCSHSYDATLEAPDARNTGVHRQSDCVTRRPVDKED